jgi:LacI family transcriptional regulator
MTARRKVLMLLSIYDTATHRGIARVSRELGWHLNLNAIDQLLLPTHWEGDGIICSLNNNRRLEEFVKWAGVPCVDLSIWRSDLGFPRVTADDACIGRLAAEHFCLNGHAAFGWFSRLRNPVSAARLNSFKEELKRHGKPPPTELTGRKVHSQKAVVAWLKSMEKPSALFAYNDIDAAWLLNCCADAGYRVPGDFAILGVDDNPLICELQTPSLSSIKHDHERIGAEGALMLDRIMSGESCGSTHQMVPPTGISVRQSSDRLATDDRLVQKAVSFMTKNFHRSIGTAEIAEAAEIGRRNLELRFKSALGCGVHQKLLEFRLKQAEYLLCQGDEKIEHIAAVTGFCHAPHLCRAFKKAFGASPQVYRRNYRKRLQTSSSAA